MELGSIMEFLNNKSILVIGATGFLAKNIVPSQKKFISSRLTNYDFVPLIFVVMCCDKINLLTMLFSNFGSFCGEDIEGSTQSEEALSSSKSRGH